MDDEKFDQIIESENWKDMLIKRNVIKQKYEKKKIIRRQMWEELGFVWVEAGVLGDICLGMGSLTPTEANIFYKELKRRCEEDD